MVCATMLLVTVETACIASALLHGQCRAWQPAQTVRMPSLSDVHLFLLVRFVERVPLMLLYEVCLRASKAAPRWRRQ